MYSRDRAARCIEVSQAEDDLPTAFSLDTGQRRNLRAQKPSGLPGKSDPGFKPISRDRRRRRLLFYFDVPSTPMVNRELDCWSVLGCQVAPKNTELKNELFAGSVPPNLCFIAPSSLVVKPR
jgi:hypothetical protein